MNEERKKPAGVRSSIITALKGAILCALLAILLPLPIAVLVEFVPRLLFGWLNYLRRTLPNIGFNLEMILCGLGALGLAVWLAHRFIRWFREAGDDQPERQPWPLSATPACTALLLLMFGAAIAITGIAHQTGWLMRDKLVEGSFAQRGRASKALQLAKQLSMGLREHVDETGNAPQTLEALRSLFEIDDLADFHALFTGPLPDGDRWLYFPEAVGSSDDMKILLVSPKPIRKQWVVVFADGSGGTPKTLHGLDLPFHPAPALDPIPAAER